MWLGGITTGVKSSVRSIVCFSSCNLEPRDTASFALLVSGARLNNRPVDQSRIGNRKNNSNYLASGITPLSLD